MANQQIYPSSSYPGAGDLQTTPGSPSTTVTGWQGVPVSPTRPVNQQIPVYESTTNQWTPTSATLTDNDSISVNGANVSDDYWVFVVRKDTEVQVNTTHPPNGFPILVSGVPANTF